MSITQTKISYDFSTTPHTSKTTTETFAQGAVLKVWTNSYRIMSDVWGTGKWATYWNEAESKIDCVLIDVCDYNWSNMGSAEVDATPETLAKVEAFLYAKNFAYAKNELETVSRVIEKGDTVKVVSGRTAKGTVGKVVVETYKPYKTGYSSRDEKKFGVATSDVMIDYAAPNGKVYKNHKDMVWVWARNCEVVQTRPVNPDDITFLANSRTKAEMNEYAACAARKAA